MRYAIALIAFLWVSPALAAEVWISPSGAGAENGTSCANAYDGSVLANWQTAYDDVGSGDWLNVVEGSYSGFTADLVTLASNKNIRTVMSHGDCTALAYEDSRPTITGDWVLGSHTGGSTLFSFPNGADNITIQGIRSRNWNTHYELKNHENDGIVLSRIDAREGRYGIWIRGISSCTGATEDLTASNDINMTDVVIKNFTKSAVRAERCAHDWHLHRFEIDMGGSTYDKGDFCLAMNIGAGNTNTHNFTIRDGLTGNCQHDNGGSYWNGDGVSIEETAYDYEIHDVVSIDNADSGFDLKWDDSKGAAPVLSNLVAIGNMRGLRPHGISGNTGEATCTNCLFAFSTKFGGNGTADGVWADGDFRCNNCTVHDNEFSNGESAQVHADSGHNADLEFHDSIITLPTDVARENIVIHLDTNTTVNGSATETDLESNNTEVWNESGEDTGWGGGNGTDPEFVDETAEDYRQDLDDVRLNPMLYQDGDSFTKGYHNKNRSQPVAAMFM